MQNKVQSRGTREAGRFKVQSSLTWNLGLGTLNSRTRAAFTLTELLIVIAIIGIMTGLGLSALAGATELAREQRTRSIIAKLDQLVMERYESYRTRAVPIRIPPGTAPQFASRARLNALRDLMRLELPDRKSDVTDPPCYYNPLVGTAQMQQPSLWRSYRRQAQRNCGASWATNWTATSQGAECLYLIVSTMHDGDKNALDFFSSDEIGDFDEDGMKEILDGWGRPVEFLRWPAGYTIEQPGDDWQWGGGSNDPTAFDPDTSASKDFRFSITTQSRDYRSFPDPFDPIKADLRWSDATVLQKPYALRPLIMSSGRDKEFDVVTDNPASNIQYSIPATPNNSPNPYFSVNVPIAGTNVTVLIGTPGDTDNNGINFADNITNHYQQTP